MSTEQKTKTAVTYQTGLSNSSWEALLIASLKKTNKYSHNKKMITTKSEILNPTPSGKIYIIEKIGIDVVHGCQLRCLGCPNSTLKPKIIEMPPEDFGKILANIDVAAANLLRLFNFGEPLIHSRLPEIMEQIPRKRWQVGMVEISTNAQYHNFDVLADTFKTGVLSQLCVSADGDGTAEDYERLRPPGKWTRLIEFLETARDLRDRYSPKTKLLARTICTDPIAQKRGSSPICGEWGGAIGSP